MVDISYGILMVIAWQVRFEDLIDKIERVDGLKQFKVLTLSQLAHISLGGIEHYALLKLFRPYQLYLSKELLP